jgi:glyoxylase-like metal-dependent hydrolase (beta-lactamase superfamily II)
MALKVKRFLTSVNASNCYLCWCTETKEGAIVDPSEFSEDMRAVIAKNEIKIVAILITHGHYDHDSAVEDVRAEHDVPVYAVNAYGNGSQVEDDDVIEIGESSLYVAATPGHTPDSITFIGEGVAFVGDALFAAAVGGTASRDLFEQETGGVREHILSLPDCTILYPGHGPATTAAVERAYNPFFVD